MLSPTTLKLDQIEKIKMRSFLGSETSGTPGDKVLQAVIFRNYRNKFVCLTGVNGSHDNPGIGK
ncbi:MAG: hypothetical protein UV29_C0041G0002 [Candidatus Collierbacteria bacterium GW2011_GWD2_42_50]|nr:MAG: hypothetical protein UV29_C0041G0002 [Candidatus Collierbacteria bacterium GW2011_GWD2_42_50]